jgi:hypothetical protein
LRLSLAPERYARRRLVAVSLPRKTAQTAEIPPERNATGTKGFWTPLKAQESENGNLNRKYDRNYFIFAIQIGIGAFPNIIGDFDHSGAAAGAAITML